MRQVPAPDRLRSSSPVTVAATHSSRTPLDCSPAPSILVDDAVATALVEARSALRPGGPCHGGGAFGRIHERRA